VVGASAKGRVTGAGPVPLTACSRWGIDQP
jgi:hypothetical protein